jgi:hypothetical protein
MLNSRCTWTWMEAINQSFIFGVKEAKNELLQNYGYYESMLAQVANRGMLAEGRKFWEK